MSLREGRILRPEVTYMIELTEPELIAVSAVLKQFEDQRTRAGSIENDPKYTPLLASIDRTIRSATAKFRKLIEESR